MPILSLNCLNMPSFYIRYIFFRQNCIKVRFCFEVDLSWTLSKFAYFWFPCPLGLVWTWWMANPEITVRPVSTNPRWLRQRASSSPPKLPSQSSASMTLSNCSQSRKRAGIRTRKLWSLDLCRVKRLQIGPNRFNFCIYTREALHGCCSSVGCARCLFTVLPLPLPLELCLLEEL